MTKGQTLYRLQLSLSQNRNSHCSFQRLYYANKCATKLEPIECPISVVLGSRKIAIFTLASGMLERK
jgi:hypothetical protein